MKWEEDTSYTDGPNSVYYPVYVFRENSERKRSADFYLYQYTSGETHKDKWECGGIIDSTGALWTEEVPAYCDTVKKRKKYAETMWRINK